MNLVVLNRNSFQDKQSHSFVSEFRHKCQKCAEHHARSFSILTFMVSATACFTGEAYSDESPSSPPPMPVRVPRSFFQDQNLLGTLSAQLPNKDVQVEFKSPIAWVEEGTTQPAPQPGALADFRDHPGCAYYSDADSVGVCFNMMGDVYSLGINSREVQLRGIEDFVSTEISDSTHSQKCSYAIQNLQFNEASRDANQVTIKYTADAVPGDDCNLGKQTVQLQFQLQKI